MKYIQSPTHIQVKKQQNKFIKTKKTADNNYSFFRKIFTDKNDCLQSHSLNVNKINEFPATQVRNE